MPIDLAGEITDNEYEGLLAHLTRFPKFEQCPICEGDRWVAPTIKEHGVYIKEREKRMSGVLLVSLVCETCAYVRQLAWRGVTKPVAQVVAA